MSGNGWEQRLADLGQARELREEIAAVLAETSDAYDPRDWADYLRTADALLSGPLAPLLAAQAAVERAAEEYRIFGLVLHDVKQAELFADVAKELRAALDGPS